MCLCIRTRGTRSQDRGTGVLRAGPAKTFRSWPRVFPARRVARGENNRLGHARRSCGVGLADVGSIPTASTNQGPRPQGRGLGPSVRRRTGPRQLADYPRIADACQEFIVSDGARWAHLTGEFVKLNRDGSVRATRDCNDRIVAWTQRRPLCAAVAFHWRSVAHVASAEGSRRSNSFFTTA